ncbi:MAG TPA: DUF3300 domain-containing protein, partial [Gammaproteobacteria bacterium]|nr:DUF3300 domain-containing protein [Gammaproteobacteria bacterium]
MDTQARFRSTRAVPWLAPRLWLAFGVLALGAAIAALRPAAAQENLAGAEELRELVGPIALYPDDLVAIVLPASTYPLQIVQAARFLEDRKRDSSLKPDEDWDDSVVALLNYPEVIKLLNDDLDWTYDLGTAVLNQREDVLSAIQDFRDEAYAAGNLRSDERQIVAREDDAIEIKPANPQVIYVPYYEPEQVVVYQPAPVYYYYPVAYPVYYYPYPAHHHFHTGFFWGVNTWFSIGWHSHYLHVYDPFYYGHPYYGWTYYDPFYVRNVYVNVNHYHYPNYVWEPRYRDGGRPVTRSSEGRVYTADRDRTPHRGALDSSTTRTREGSVDRARGGAASGAQPSTDTAQANRTRTTPNGRSTRAETPPGQTHGQTHQPVRQARESGQVQAREPGGSTDGSAAQPSRTRSGGGMSQALERSRAPQANADARTGSGAARSNPSMARANPGVSPRASERSTGMPQQSSRSAPPRYQQAAPQREAPPPRQQQSFDSSSRGGGTSAQRSQPPSGGGQPGNSGGNGGGSYRGNSGGGNSGGGH